MNKNNTDDKKNYNSKKKADMEDKDKDKKKPNEEQVVNNDNQNESNINEKSEAEQLKDRITELEALVNSHKDKMLRAVADCENTKKRMQRDKEDAVSFANKEIIKDLIPCLDSFDAALSSSADESVKKGIELIKTSFLTVLKKWGIEEIDDVGKDYDPSRHEACLCEEGTEDENDKVVLTLQKGYALHSQVIRPAKVKILKGKHE